MLGFAEMATLIVAGARGVLPACFAHRGLCGTTLGFRLFRQSGVFCTREFGATATGLLWHSKVRMDGLYYPCLECLVSELKL